MKEFKAIKIMGSEIETNNFNRLITEFTDILNTNLVLPDKKDKVLNEIFMCLETFRNMEQNYTKFCKIENNIYEVIYRQVQSGITNIADIEYDDPSFLLRKIFEDFMIRSQFVIRYRNKLCMVVFNDNKFDEGKYRREKIMTLLNNKRKILGDSLFYSYKQIINDDKDWLTILTQTRDKIEHVENHRLEISNFKIYKENCDIKIKLPVCLEYNKRCDKFMNIMFFNLYTYIEDFISMILNLFSDGRWIINLFNDEDYKRPREEWYSMDLGNRIYKVDMNDFIRKILPNEVEVDT
jgi:hypothetical protein